MEFLLLILIVSNVACALSVINLIDIAGQQRMALDRLSMDVFKFNMDLVHHSIQMNLLQVSLEIQEAKTQSGDDHVNS
jgi:hypothetical protein